MPHVRKGDQVVVNAGASKGKRGQVLKVMATDPGSVKDFQAFCRQTGNELLSHSEGPEYTFFMKKR